MTIEQSPHGIGTLTLKFIEEMREDIELRQEFNEFFQQEISVIDESRTIDSVSLPYTELESDTYAAIPDRIGSDFVITLIDIQMAGSADLEYELFDVSNSQQLYSLTASGLRSDEIFSFTATTQILVEHRIWNRASETEDIGGKITYQLRSNE